MKRSLFTLLFSALFFLAAFGYRYYVESRAQSPHHLLLPLTSAQKEFLSKLEEHPPFYDSGGNGKVVYVLLNAGCPASEELYRNIYSVLQQAKNDLRFILYIYNAAPDPAYYETLELMRGTLIPPEDFETLELFVETRVFTLPDPEKENLDNENISPEMSAFDRLAHDSGWVYPAVIFPQNERYLPGNPSDPNAFWLLLDEYGKQNSKN